MLCTVEQLSMKEVISVDTAARVGMVADVEFDMETGEMVHLCVIRGGGFFKPKPPVKICRKDIVMIGAETVLVKNVPTPPPQGGKRALLGFLK